MASTLRKLFQIQLGSSDGLLYTAPAQTRTTIVLLMITNTDTADRTFRLHQVSAAGSSSAANALYYDEPIVAKRVHPNRNSGIILEPAQMLRGLGSAATVITVSGFGIETTEPA